MEKLEVGRTRVGHSSAHGHRIRVHFSYRAAARLLEVVERGAVAGEVHAHHEESSGCRMSCLS
jgi:hypothetical protein